MRRKKWMKELPHWVQYFYRISGDTTIVDMNKFMFIERLDTALYRSVIRKKLVYQSNTKSKEASLVTLESENKWKEWESKFINYLFIFIGVNVVPFSYMMQKTDNPDENGYFPNFIDKTRACAPLKVNYYEVDLHTYHQALVSFTTGHPSEDWLKATSRYRDGRPSMKSLSNQFAV